MKPLIAITGSVGAGKSFVARALNARGAFTIDADALAREAVAPGSPTLSAIVDAFGDDLLGSGGQLDRGALAKRVFGDPRRVEALNAIVHPAVHALSAERMRVGLATGAPYVLYEIPLLFETGRAADFDAVVVVHAPDTLRRMRIEQRDGPARASEMAQREMHQLPQATKCARADYVVDTSAADDVVQSDIDSLHAALCRERSDAAKKLAGTAA